MELQRLIDELGRPQAFPDPVDRVEVRQTHISAVFLAGEFAYKLKKAVNLGFVDFSTLEKRRHFCDEEVRLNRRLAADVYLGVVPITETADGLRFEGEGETVDWAVQMRRLPEEATLREKLRHGEVATELVDELARRIADFHRCARGGPEVSDLGRFDAVARNLRDIYRQSVPQIGLTVHADVFQRLEARHEEMLARLRPLIDERASRGCPRDLHGDLHLDHIYVFPERQPPNDLVIVDCIEFNDRFRFIDPVSDMAFPAMDLAYYGRRDLARSFSEAYFRATGDDEGRALLPLYLGYRTTVRGSVEGIKLAGKEIAAADRGATLEKSRAHWLLGLTVLEEPGRRPCLVLVAGLPGTGKSTLARQLAEHAGFHVLRSDVVRKELAGLAVEAPAPDAARDRLYAKDATNDIYAECLRRVQELLFQGRRVVVDATFGSDTQRCAFLDTARRWGVPAVILALQADPEAVKRRLARRRDDASDADWSVYQKLSGRWEPPSPQTQSCQHPIRASDDGQAPLRQALAVLQSLELVSP